MKSLQLIFLTRKILPSRQCCLIFIVFIFQIFTKKYLVKQILSSSKYPHIHISIRMNRRYGYVTVDKNSHHALIISSQIRASPKQTHTHRLYRWCEIICAIWTQAKDICDYVRMNSFDLHLCCRKDSRRNDTAPNKAPVRNPLCG